MVTIDEDFIGRFLTDEKRQIPEVRDHILNHTRTVTSGYFYSKLMKPTMIHEAGHAVYAEKVGCKGTKLVLPYVELSVEKVRSVFAAVSYDIPPRASATDLLTVALAGPLAEEKFAPNCHTRATAASIWDLDLKAGKEKYLEHGGVESDFENDCERVIVDIIDELNNDKWFKERIYTTAEKFRREFPMCKMKDECYHQPIQSPETEARIAELTERMRGKKDALLLLEPRLSRQR